MMMRKRLPGILFGLGILICLLQIFVPDYFVTGDGPVHVYNSKILSDLWQDRDTSFWLKYYTPNTQMSPNWSTHIVLAFLMRFFSGAMAEKIFLAAYAVVFTTGFAFLCKKLNPASGKYFPLVGFLFVFTHPLIKGFFNFSMSIAIGVWVIWSFLTLLEKRSWPNILLFAFLSVLCFLTHGMGWLYATMLCGIILLFQAFRAENRNRNLLIITIIFLLVNLPLVSSLYRFMASADGLGIQLSFDPERLETLPYLETLINRSSREDFWVAFAGIILLLATIPALFRAGKKLPYRYLALVVTLLVFLAIFLFFPNWFNQGGLFTMRAQLLFFICCAMLICASGLKKSLKNGIGLTLFSVYLILSSFRSSGIMAASDGVADWLSASDHIPAYSIVLPLSFNHNGQTSNGLQITDRNWLFMHASEYMGAQKPLIMLDNYEANTSYFPLKWVPDINPFAHLSAHETIEGQPPFAAIEAYRDLHNTTIDYIALWCYDATFLNQGHTRELMDQVHRNYNLIYTSPSKRTLLYEKKPIIVQQPLPIPNTTPGKIISDETLKLLNGE